MDLKFVLHFLVLAAAVELRSIEVYEDVDDTPSVPFSLRTIQPNKNQRLSWAGTAQQDLQKRRYFQQQQVDTHNRTRNRFLLRGRNASNQSLSINIKKREIKVPGAGFPMIFLTPPKTRSVNLGLDHSENVRLLQESLGEIHQDKELRALNNLIGQAPMTQLQGLQQLLNPKSYKPITEDLMDYANPETHPNVRVEHALRPTDEQHFKAIEQQLNEAAEAEAQEIIRKAEQAALAEEEAQRQALLKTQSEATKAHQAAFAKIEAQRQATLAAHSPYGKTHQAAPAVTPHKGHQIFALHPSVLLGQRHVEESKKAYGGEKDDLQYASQYAFGYRVRDFHSGNDYGHEEVHDGHTAKGNYHVLLPDGRLQHVQYWADETGFHSKVTYDRFAKHPH